MKIIDRYIMRELGMALLGVLFISIIIMMVYRVTQVFEDILRNSPDIFRILIFFLYSIPGDLVQVLPACVAIAVLITVGYMAKSNEILAMFSSGISPLRVAVPLLGASFLLSLLMFYLSEMVVPTAQARARDIERADIEGKGKSIRTKANDVYQKGRGKRFYALNDYDPDNKVMIGVTIFDVNDDNTTFRWRMDADKGEFTGGAANNIWKFYNAREWNYETGAYIQHAEPVEVALDDRADEFLGIELKPEEMNVFELGELIGLRAGTGEDVRAMRAEWHLKISYPLSIIIIALFCCALAIRANFRTLMIGFGVGLLMTIGFYGVVMLFRMFGQQAILPPMLAAWAANLIFLGIGTHLLLKRA